MEKDQINQGVVALPMRWFAWGRQSVKSLKAKYMGDLENKGTLNHGPSHGRVRSPSPWGSPARLLTMMLIGLLGYLNYLYVWETTPSLAYQDFVGLRNFIEASAQQTHSFSDFFAVQNGVFKNPALFWVLDMDVRHVGFDQRYELYFYLSFKVLTAVILVFAIWRAYPSAGLMAVVPTLPLFSIGQWENLVLSVGGYFFAPVCAIIAFQQFGAIKARPGYGAWLWYIGLFLAWCLAFLFFTASYTVPAALALICVFILDLIHRRNVSIVPSVLAGVGLILYLFFPRINAGAGGLRIEHWDQVVTVCHFFVVNIGACYMHSEQGLSLVSVTWIGACALIVNVGAVYYLARKGDHLSQLCLFLLVFSLFTSAVISLGRFHFGPAYALASRYTTVTCLSQVSLLIVVIGMLSRLGAQRLIALAGISVFAASLYFANRRELAIQPARRAIYRDIANGVRNRCRDDAFLRAFQADNVNDVPKYLDMIERHHLSVFKDN